jgi:MoxR-like ATPase
MAMRSDTPIQSLAQRLSAGLHTRVVGLDDTIELLAITVLSGQHALLEGVPGLAKTLLVQSLAESMDLRFARIQFTPDLMPADITGTEVIAEDAHTGTREFRFLKGPLFANLVLADEINRTPPKTQAALMEAMEERQVTVRGERTALEEPFSVLATRNPIEQEGTYPLPAAQLDRFLFLLKLDYPGRGDELKILRRTTAGTSAEMAPCLTQADVLNAIHEVRSAALPEDLARRVSALIRMTRPSDASALEVVRQHVQLGAGPRAGQMLTLAMIARARLQGRSTPTLEDMRALVHPVLRHRLILKHSAVAENLDADAILEQVLGAALDARAAH